MGANRRFTKAPRALHAATTLADAWRRFYDQPDTICLGCQLKIGVALATAFEEGPGTPEFDDVADILGDPIRTASALNALVWTLANQLAGDDQCGHDVFASIVAASHDNNEEQAAGPVHELHSPEP